MTHATAPISITPSRCRLCGGTLVTILKLGTLQLTGYLTPDEPARPGAPLTFTACGDCGLAQLADTVSRDALFADEYWYRSGVNEVMRAELDDVVEYACAQVGGLEPRDVVIDIGANDGTLLQAVRMRNPHVTRIGIEPAANLEPLLRAHAEIRIRDYFPLPPGALVLPRRATIITSIATFYAVQDPLAYAAAVYHLLDDDGVWIVQLQDLAQMIAATAFDNICHEHLGYYSLASLERLLAGSGLAIVDAQRRSINGGSLRVAIRHAQHPVQPSVAALRQLEAPWIDWVALERFAWQVQRTRVQIIEVLEQSKQYGETVDLYGASTKANTLLQYCGLSTRELRQAWERAPEKVGRRTAGSNIPIVTEEWGRSEPPDALFAGVWQFRTAIVDRESDFLREGGRFIFPLPEVDVVTASSRRKVGVS